MIRQIHLTLGAVALFAVAFAAVLVGSAGDSYAAANLLANGYFDANVTNWTAQADASVTHDPAEDFHTNPSSGSAYVVRTSGGLGDAIVLSECIDITATGTNTGDGTYRITGQVKRDPASWSGQLTVPTGDDPQVELIVTKFTDTGCSAGAAPVGLGSILLSNDNWIHASNDGLPGNVIVSGEQSLQVSMVIHAQANGDSAWFDIIGLTFTDDLDTPTPTNSPIATDTPPATNTPVPTDTPIATNTPVATNTPLPTDTPVATNTAVPTETAVAPTNTSVPGENTPETLEVGEPPASAADNAGAAGAGGESPEGGAGAGEEEPEAGEVPESGTGPGSYSQERSHIADMVALGSFTLAIIMLGAGFALRKKYEEV
jgi:hypothetical protein